MLFFFFSVTAPTEIYSLSLHDALPICPIGAGTERAEERLQILFPDTPVLRIDRDSTSRKGSMDALLSTIGSGQPCIMIGTQMLAKGHHFPRVTLVAILNADEIGRASCRE